MSRRIFIIFLFILSSGGAEARSPKDLKIHVLLGLHVDFYHSWRGNRNDPTGFGHDIEVIRGVQKELESAEKQGLQTKVYWDMSSVHWTLGDFVPNHAPDILQNWQKHAQSGRDEILVGPYNNGMASAATREEFTQSLRLSLKNDGGFGLEQLFPKVEKTFRPQEAMYTAGLSEILKEEGFRGLILPYSSIPFTSFTNFVPVLSWKDRFSPIVYKTHPTDTGITLLPSISPGDLLNFSSLEKLLLKLRDMQLSGAIDHDLMININFDADADSWLPLVDSELAQSVLPNTGGIKELVEIVNNYGWAQLSHPSEVLDSLPARSEVYVPQDVADGSYDGYYSWAEKFTAHQLWTHKEQALIARRRATAIQRMIVPDTQARSDEVSESALLSLSTTHFGMVTPFLHGERELSALSYVLKEKDLAFSKYRQVTQELQDYLLASSTPQDNDCKKIVLVNAKQDSLHHSLRKIKVLSEQKPLQTKLAYTDGAEPRQFLASDKYLGAGVWELTYLVEVKNSNFNQLCLTASSKAQFDQELNRPQSFEYKGNGKYLKFSRDLGLHRWQVGGKVFSQTSFLTPHVSMRIKNKTPRLRNSHRNRLRQQNEVNTWKNENFYAKDFEILKVRKGRLGTSIEMKSTFEIQTSEGLYTSTNTYLFIQPHDSNTLFLESITQLPQTPEKQELVSAQSRFSRPIDTRWIEVAPLEMNPSLRGSRVRSPLKVVRRNYLEHVGEFEFVQGRVNPKNANLASSNNQVTRGWFGIEDNEGGLLFVNTSPRMRNFAMSPMRLHDRDGLQTVQLNPFGSYHGRQLDYSHMGGSGMGNKLVAIAASYIRSNAPTYNGKKLHYDFAILPFASVKEKTKAIAVATLLAEDLETLQEDSRGKLINEFESSLKADTLAAEQFIDQLNQQEQPLKAIEDFRVNTYRGGAYVVWTKPTDPRIDHVVVAYKNSRSSKWKQRIYKLPKDRTFEVVELQDLPNKVEMEFRVSAAHIGRKKLFSPWSHSQSAFIDTPEKISIAQMSKAPFFALRYLFSGLWHRISLEMDGK